MKNHIFITLLYVLGIVLFSSCELYQEPEGNGVDPTDVTVDVELSVNLTLPEADDLRRSRAASDEYMHRFVIEAVTSDYKIHDRRIVYEAVGSATRLNIPISMRLHAREYNIIVWSDYVGANDLESNIFYDPESLTPVYPVSPFKANNEYKDAFCGRVKIDLRPYSDEWQAKIVSEIELSRPVGRYELISTDIKAFKNKVENGIIGGKSFTARIRYAGYVATGFNVLEQTPKNMLNFLSYKTALNFKASDMEEMCIGFDYIMCRNLDVSLPLDLEVMDENGVVVSTTPLSIPVMAGYNTTVRGRFLTNTSDGGAIIDGDYDGSIDIDLGEL